MTYLDVLTKHGYVSITGSLFRQRGKAHYAEIYKSNTNTTIISLYKPAGGYTLNSRMLYNTGLINPTPEELDILIRLLTA